MCDNISVVYRVAKMMNHIIAIRPHRLVEYHWQDHLTLEVVVYLPMKRVGSGRESIGIKIRIVLHLTVTLTVCCLEQHYKLVLHLDVL